MSSHRKRPARAPHVHEAITQSEQNPKRSAKKEPVIQASPADYKGYRPKKYAQIARINWRDITPEQFFNEYVAKRRPIVLVGLLEQDSYALLRWTNAYLIKRAGAADVQIEPRGATGTFGTGTQKTRMAFGDFVKKIEGGAEDLYLTTQYDDNDDDDDGEPRITDLLPPPVSHLLGDFPLRPPLLPTLVPQQINLWMGNSKDGASSGLHFDYHDNLYHLLRGRKRFLLFAPYEYDKLYIHGENPRLHHNGLISFSPDVRADGAPLQQVQEWKAARKANDSNDKKKNKNKNKKRAADDDDDDDDDDDEDEDEEAALEAALEAAMKGGRGRDDFAEIAELGSDDAEEEEGSAKRRRAAKKEKQQRKKSKAAASEPPSFSRIDVPTLRSSLRSPIFPLLSETSPISVEISAGDALYLPASWFHEVTSYSNGETGGHLALNYWFHPPTTASFATPYEDDYWAARYAKLEPEALRMQQRQRKGK